MAAGPLSISTNIFHTTQDIEYANDAAAEEDYAETQQNTDTEAASSDAEGDTFGDMHADHAAGRMHAFT